jgi:polyphosphate kinase 2 (PPK2 family)
VKNLAARARQLSKPYRVEDGKGFRLRDVDPADTAHLESADADRAREALREGVELLAEYQNELYAQDRWALLLIFQAMDAAGKLVARVHPAVLQRQKQPPELVGKRIWEERYQDIRNFERYLARNGVVIRKFFLHVSKDEQKRRFLARLDEPEKHWKFSANDVAERRHWDEDAIRETASEAAPWYVVPADHEWFTRLVVAAAIVDALAGLGLHYPKVTPAQRRELAAARRALARD